MQQRLISAAVMVPIVLVVFLLGPAVADPGPGHRRRARGRRRRPACWRAAGLPVERALVIALPPIAVLGMGWGGAPEGAGHHLRGGGRRRRGHGGVP